MTKSIILATLLAATTMPAAAQQLSPDDRQQLIAKVDADARPLSDAALQIWKFAEVGYQEPKAPRCCNSG